MWFSYLCFLSIFLSRFFAHSSITSRLCTFCPLYIFLRYRYRMTMASIYLDYYIYLYMYLVIMFHILIISSSIQYIGKNNMSDSSWVKSNSKSVFQNIPREVVCQGYIIHVSFIRVQTICRLIVYYASD